LQRIIEFDAFPNCSAILASLEMSHGTEAADIVARSMLDNVKSLTK
jgi:hypothetical protein